MSESAHETREEEQKSGEMDKNGRNQGGGLKRRQMDRTVEITSGRSRETQCRRPLTNYFNLHLKSILPRRDVSRLHLHLQNSLKSLSFLLHFGRASWLNSEQTLGDGWFV